MTQTALSPTHAEDLEATDAPRSAARSARFVLAALLFALALLWPAAWNGAPILFSDSASYLRSGEAALEAVGRLSEPGGGGPRAGDLRGYGISTQRSVYYGAPLLGSIELAGPWLPAFAQCLAVAVTVLIAFRPLGLTGRAAPLVAAGTLVLVSGAAIFASTLMPDIFAGTMVLGAALLFAYAGALTWPERLWLFLMVFLGALFHRSNLAVAMAMVLVAAPLMAVARVRWLPTFLALSAALAVASAGHSAVDQVIRKITGYPPVPLPFLLARVIGDGTGERYLDRHCATETLFTCKFRSKMPMTENEFLWSWDPKRIAFAGEGYAGRARIDAEESGIVAGVIREYPVTQFAVSTANAVTQFFDVGATEFRRQVPIGRRLSPPIRRLLIDYQRTELAHGRIPMIQLSWLMAGTYLIGLAVGAGIASVRWRALRRGGLVDPVVADEVRFWLAFAIVVAGFVINAAVSGVLAGVFDRYQGRVAWLAALFACAAITRLARSRSGAAQPAA